MTEQLPTLNAVLNFSSAVMLLIGHSRIRAGDREGHRKWMLRAVFCSSAFLVSYLVFHYLHGSTKFAGEGFARTAYFTILSTHTVLAVVNVPLVGFGLYHALAGRFGAHRRIVRWAYPVWLYVSVTGVVIYLLLYHLYAPA